MPCLRNLLETDGWVGRVNFENRAYEVFIIILKAMKPGAVACLAF